MAKETMFQLACMILHDQCPPDNRMYYCNMGEDPECDCTGCWDRYLWWAVNGYKDNDEPYRFDRKREIR